MFVCLFVCFFLAKKPGKVNVDNLINIPPYFNAAKCALDLNYTGLQQSYESVGKIIDKSYIQFLFGENEPIFRHFIHDASF